MLKRTEAVVLRTTPFSEADLIVTSLTLDYGLVRTFAKSPLKTMSRFGSSLEPLTYSRISFWGKEDTALPRLTQSDIIRPFQSIRDTIDCFFAVMEIVELTLNLLPEREPNRDIFDLLISVLNRFDKGSAGDSRGNLDTLFYRIRFLDMVGYGPRLDGCARCGRSGYNFYISHGSVVCEVCAEGVDAPMRLSPGVVRIYETLRKWDLPKIDRIKLPKALLSELSNMLDTHIRYTAAKPLKTKNFRT
ncbi:MAG TPA: DNA repair protein RecO [Thermodesulfovibrionales bacterium]|nr:DNA repair protein RecO [Thermodesulfovibrionales bacterium]